MPEAAAAWEVDGAGRSVPASLLSGKKGTLPSSKLAMVVSTQLVWAVGTKRICWRGSCYIRTLASLLAVCSTVQQGQGFCFQAS